MSTPPRPLVDRFWEKVDKNGPVVIAELGPCWEWTGALSSGYGSINIGSHTTEGAHRVSYVLKHGRIPDGLYVLHKCGHRPCVNPDHLYAGDQSENMRDLMALGWRPTPQHGDAHGMRINAPKLSRDKAEQIRQLYASGRYSQYEIAEMFDVRQSMISRVVNGVRW
jgi:hypothetical protein